MEEFMNLFIYVGGMLVFTLLIVKLIYGAIRHVLNGNDVKSHVESHTKDDLVETDNLVKIDAYVNERFLDAVDGTFEEKLKTIVNKQKMELPKEFKERIDRFNRLFVKGTENTENPHNFEQDELYKYEMYCIDEAVNLINFFKTDEIWNALVAESKTETPYDFVEFLKKNKGLTIDDRHSGNSMEQSFSLAKLYLHRPDLIPFQHGCLAQLVGDKGYYDDRGDVPKTK